MNEEAMRLKEVKVYLGVVTEIHISDQLLNISYIVLSTFRKLPEISGNNKTYSERYCSSIIVYFQPLIGIKLGLKDCFVSC